MESEWLPPVETVRRGPAEQDSAYYKMPESLGPEYEWYNGSLVL